MQKEYKFDNIFESNTTQQQIFTVVEPLLKSAQDGHSVCIPAYGYTGENNISCSSLVFLSFTSFNDSFTGSGKTYTMNGLDTDLGVIPQTIKYLSGLKENASGWSWSLALSMYEIYNNKIYDLIDSSKTKPVIVDSIENLNKIQATIDTNLLDVWYTYVNNRKTTSTIGNASSSRSHAITKLELTSNNYAQQKTRTATINLVDLAGSESAKSTDNIDETKAINSSLAALTGVILNLKKGTKVIDYSQCMLTKVLKPSLSDQSKTLLIINLASSDVNACTKTLTFASAMAK